MGSFHFIFLAFVSLGVVGLGKCLRIAAPSSEPFPSKASIPGVILPKISLYNGSIYGSPYYGIENAGSTGDLLFQNETVIIVPSTKPSLSLKCEAPYPVFWNLAHSNVHPIAYNSLRVMSTREFEDPFDPTTFTYRSVLTLSGSMPQLSGNYSCQCTARHEISSSMVIFWQTNFASSVFVHSKENITIYVDSTGVVKLPCQVSDPDMVPILKKETGHVQSPFETIGRNDSVLYSPSVGFTLKDVPNPGGRYQCDLNKNDYVYVNIVQKNASQNAVKKSYTFTYDDDNKQVTCCSSGKKPPKVFFMICEHPSTCGVREHLTAPSLHITWNPGRRKGNCSYLNLRTFHTGLVRCVGEGGFNQYKEFITPVRVDHLPWNGKRNTTTYFRWEEIDPQEMIAVSDMNYRNPYIYSDLGLPPKSQIQKKPTLYSMQKVRMKCHTSRYYFASGTYWMIRWRNKTLTSAVAEEPELNGMQDDYLYYEDQHKHINTFSFTANTDMESLLCFAPVWNSSVWVTKIHYLYVNETIPPRISEAEIVQYTWYANETEKVLNCSGSGDPSPTFSWEKDNLTILATAHNYQVVLPNVTLDTGKNSGNVTNLTRLATALTSLRISRVSYHTKGVFRCVADNFGGRAFKEFHISVIEVKSWRWVGVLCGGGIVAFFLLAGIIYLLKKVQKDRQEIKQLTSVNFKDVSRGSSASTARADDEEVNHGGGFDNGKMTNNLIDAF